MGAVECPICLGGYDEERYPVLLSCGNRHSCCVQCCVGVRDTARKDGRVPRCALCRKPFFSAAKNFDLLAAALQLKTLQSKLDEQDLITFLEKNLLFKEIQRLEQLLNSK